MIYKLESINRTIAKVVRDLGLGGKSIDYQDMIEWIADALQDIGAYAQFEEVERPIAIFSYSGELPCDLYKVVRLKPGCNVELKSSSTGYYNKTLQEALERAGVDFSLLSVYEQEMILNPAKPRLVSPYSNTSNGFHLNKHLFGNISKNRLDCNDYNIQGNKINVGFEEGVVTIQYLRIPVDEEGFPLVPDDTAFRNALFWNIAMHLSMRSPEMLNNQRLKDYEYCRQMWNRYCGQARARANMPDIHMAENLKNTFFRQIRDLSAPLTDYTDIGTPQNLNLNGTH